jgi:putative ABC transport system substrate-binding protein
MRRREFILLLGATAAWPRTVTAQSPSKVYRVGSLIIGAPIADNSRLGAALIRGLAQHGYAIDKNLTFEHRGAEMQMDRLPRLVNELVTSKVDVIVAFGYPAALAAKQGTTLPVVSFTTGDPVGTGLVDGLARPGGHITGISDVSAEITPKRLELLKDMAPGLRRVAVLWNAADLGMTLRYRAAEAGAKVMGITVQPLGVREPNDFDQVFAAMNSDMPDAILMVHDALTSLNRKRVFEFAAAHRLPAISAAPRSVRLPGARRRRPAHADQKPRMRTPGPAGRERPAAHLVPRDAPAVLTLQPRRRRNRRFQAATFMAAC